MKKIPFNRPYTTGREIDYIREAVDCNHLSSGGQFSKRCEEWLEQTVGCGRALLTHSCTAALEMAALLAGIEPGDEVIMPSFTFVSTANAFVLRGGVPVFVDISPDTLNIDQRQYRGGADPTHPRDRARPLCGRRLRDGAHHRNRAGTRRARHRRRGAGIGRQVSGHPARPIRRPRCDQLS